MSNDEQARLERAARLRREIADLRSGDGAKPARSTREFLDQARDKLGEAEQPATEEVDE
jgi:hypothetical protein